MRFWLPALLAMAVVPAAAHHPFTPYYDISRPASITGVVAELRIANPHVVLIVEGPGPDGTTGRWAFEGIPPGALRRQQQDFEQRLKPGTKLTITGWAAKDPTARAFSGQRITFADGSTMVFGPAPEQADRWTCGSGPRDNPAASADCRYTYPDVRAQ
jgi:hypothetical protein